MAATSPPRTLLFLALLVSGRRFGDHRGFLETYSQWDFAALGLADVFVQDSHSLSAVAGTV